MLIRCIKAGSNTVQLFEIDPLDPASVLPLGDAVPSGGDFPAAAAFNDVGDSLCVINGGVQSNVQ